MAELVIVVVSHNSTDYLEGCLASIAEETQGTDFQSVVVDNASTNGDLSGLPDRYPGLQVLRNKTNVGFAAACNRGINHCRADYYLLLNPDTRILNRAIDRTLQFLRPRRKTGIVGCRVLNPDGSLQLACRRSIPRPSTALYRFLRLSTLFPGSKRLAAYNLSFLHEREIQEVEAVSGSFLMFRTDVVRTVGYLDERFFLYGEDLDFCHRARQQGWEVLYYPGASILHYKGRSARTNPGLSARHYYRSMEIFYRKHYGPQAGSIQKAGVVAAIRLLYLGHRLRWALLGDRKVESPF